MPFQSEKQRRYLWANEPEIARDWTETYGNRIQKNGGGVMHQFENYAHDDRDNVSVPRSFQARPQSDQVNLAYITPREEGILQNLKPGTPHRGPMEIPNYDSFDVSGGYATSGQLDAPTRGDIQAGVGSGGAGAGGQRTHLGPLSSGAQQAWGNTQAARDEYKKREALNLMNAQGVWGMPAFQKTTQMPATQRRGKFNPLRFLGGFFGNVGRTASGIMGMGKDFAGKMRGGINPATGKYYTQKEYEEARQKRRGQASIDRILRTKGKYDSGEIDRDWDQSPLKQRLKDLGYTGELAQGKNELGLYTDRINQPTGPGLRVGEEQGYYGLGSRYDKQGIAGTDASMDFANARRLMTQSSQIPGANPLLQADPYQQTSLIDPNTINVLGSSIYESPKRSAKDFIDLDKASWEGKETIPEDKYKGLGIQRNYMEGDLPLSMAPFKGERDKITDMKNVAFVKDPVLKAQSWYKAPLKLKQNTLSTALGENAQEKMQAFQELKRLVPQGSLTIEKYLNLAQQNKVPEIIAEDMNKQVLEAIKEQGGFGDMFPKNYSLGNIDPTIKDGRIDIDESKIDDDYRDQLKYLDI